MGEMTRIGTAKAAELGADQNEPEVEPLPDTVPSHRMVPEGGAVRVRRPPYPLAPKQSGNTDPPPKEHFSVDWRPTNTLPSGLQSVRAEQVRVSVRTVFSELPKAARDLLRRGSMSVEVGDGESVNFCMAFVARGKLCAHPGPLPLCAVSIHAGTLLRRLPQIVSMTEVRWVACGGPVNLVTWDEATTERVLELSSKLNASLSAAAHRINAQVCATIGPLGEAVCASMREDLFARSRLQMLVANELLFEVGDDLPGLVITGAGKLAQRDPEGHETTLTSGHVVCPTSVFTQSPAPVTLRALDEGASVLIADRDTLLQLACAMPSLPALLRRC